MRLLQHLRNMMPDKGEKLELGSKYGEGFHINYCIVLTLLLGSFRKVLDSFSTLSLLPSTLSPSCVNLYILG